MSRNPFIPMCIGAWIWTLLVVAFGFEWGPWMLGAWGWWLLLIHGAAFGWWLRW